MMEKIKISKPVFDEFKKYHFEKGTYALYYALEYIHRFPDSYLYDWLFRARRQEQEDNMISFSRLWGSYDPEKPEEMVEVYNNLFYFVVNSDDPEYRLVITRDGNVRAHEFTSDHSEWTKFNDMDKALEWVTPDTEVIQEALRPSTSRLV